MCNLGMGGRPFALHSTWRLFANILPLLGTIAFWGIGEKNGWEVEPIFTKDSSERVLRCEEGDTLSSLHLNFGPTLEPLSSYKVGKIVLRRLELELSSGGFSTFFSVGGDDFAGFII